jgi:hypothetical protein
MNDKEAEYYASEFSDAQIDTMADAGDFYLKESGFYLMPTKAEIEKMMVEGEGYLWLKEVLCGQRSRRPGSAGNHD